MNMIMSEYDDPHVGNIKFSTFESYNDPYTEWVRDNWNVEPITLLASTLISDGDSFIDLGANIGAFCLPLSLMRRSPFLAVEALPDNVDLLESSIRANNIDNARVVNAAIMDKEVPVHIKGASAYGTVNSDGQGITIQSVVGDKLFPEAGFENARLVKIDIEGSELFAIKGMRKFLEGNVSRSYIFEANGAHCYSGGYQPSEIVEIFEEIGYNIYMVAGLKIIPYKSTDLQPFGLINFLATKSLPDDLGYGFSIGTLTKDQNIFAIVRALTEMKPGYRSFMLEELKKAPVDIITDERITKAIRQD